MCCDVLRCVAHCVIVMLWYGVTLLYCVVSCCIVSYRCLLRYGEVCCAVLWCSMMSCVVLCCVVLRCVVLWCVVVCCCVILLHWYVGMMCCVVL